MFTPSSPESSSLTKNQIISQLVKSPHGDLAQYVPVASRAAREEPEFYSHLIAWNHINGQVRDSKVALPIIFFHSFSLSSPPILEFKDNALAHLALLDPRNLLRAIRFAKTIKTPGSSRQIRLLVERYLRTREEIPSWWERTALSHRSSLKSLYSLFHIKPSPMADLILMKGIYPEGSIFSIVANLKNLPPLEAAGSIIDHKIPFLTALGALGSRAKDPNLVLALINRMSSTELITNTATLERLGINTDPVLRAAYDEALEKSTRSLKSTLKTSKAIESSSNTRLKEKLRSTQEKQISHLQIEGNWLVLGDKSGSMAQSIEISRHVASTLAKFVKGKVYLIFFDALPRMIEATGKDYDQLLSETRHVLAAGGTSIGCGLYYTIEKNLEIDGIAIISDGNENTPPFFYQLYSTVCNRMGKDIPVYLYRVQGRRGYMDKDLAETMHSTGNDLQEFDLTSGVDYYSLPNLVQTMRVQKYGLVEQIMETPLLTLDKALLAQSLSHTMGVARGAK